MRTALSTVALLAALLALPAPPATAATPPVKILMLDGCIHSRVEQEVGKSITAVPIEIDSSAMNLSVCDLDLAKASAALLDVAKRLEAERRGKRKPITLVYTGAFLQGPGVAGTGARPSSAWPTRP